MAIDKTDVKDWINKCKSRAIDSVDKDINSYIAEIAINFPIIQSDYDFLVQTEASMKALREKYKDVEDLRFYQNVYCRDNFENEYWSRLVFKGLNALVYSYIIDNKEEYQEYYQHIKSLFDKRKKVKLEYESLNSVVMKKRKVEAMVKYLNDLGFDTSSLMTLPKNINKDLLFVCHDNKPKQEE